MEIKNEVKVDRTGPNAKEEKKFVNRSMAEVQRAKLEKLMKNPDKPVIIPIKKKEKDYDQNVPSFVRNVMGSSAGAGSGEFHVYRHLRRKEYARQKYIQIKSEQELLDEEFEKKLEGNKSKAEEKTAKKRAKRQKRKQKAKQPKGHMVNNVEAEVSEDCESGSESSQETAVNSDLANDKDELILRKSESIVTENLSENKIVQ